MERYRIEQQPQPHPRLADVRRRSSGCSGSGNGNGNGNIGCVGIDIGLRSGANIASVTNDENNITVAGAHVAGSRFDKQIESAAIGYAPTGATAAAAVSHIGSGVGQREQHEQREQREPAASQEEQSLLHQQRIQQQREQQPEQRRLPARSWLAGHRLSANASHHHGGGRHHTGGGGATRNAKSDGEIGPGGTAVSHGEGNEVAHLHERQQSEAHAAL